MVEIGGRPILWHIMKTYARWGVCDFVVCAGYKGHLIKEYFENYHLHTADVTYDLEHQSRVCHRSDAEPWRVTIVDTGAATGTGGRLLRVREYLDGEDFCLTYGDGVADVDIPLLLESHRRGARVATVTAVRPPARFGAIQAEGDRVVRFEEKPLSSGWINGGFFVFRSDIFRYIAGDDTSLELDSLPQLVSEGQLTAYHHNGFWQPMDTLRDVQTLEQMWSAGRAPWKVW